MEEESTTAQPTAEEQAQPKSYTQEEVDALLQKEGDRRVTEALKKADKKKQAAVQEAAKLAKMDEAQRYEYELEQREKAIRDKEAQLALAENKATAAGILSNRGINPDLVGLVVAEDADTMNENINLLERAFKASVKTEVEKRLASTTPKKNLPLDKSLTREDFRKMPLTSRARLKEQHPDLYQSLIS